MNKTSIARLLSLGSLLFAILVFASAESCDSHAQDCVDTASAIDQNDRIISEQEGFQRDGVPFDPERLARAYEDRKMYWDRWDGLECGVRTE